MEFYHQSFPASPKPAAPATPPTPPKPKFRGSKMLGREAQRETAHMIQEEHFVLEQLTTEVIPVPAMARMLWKEFKGSFKKVTPYRLIQRLTFEEKLTVMKGCLFLPKPSDD